MTTRFTRRCFSLLIPSPSVPSIPNRHSSCARAFASFSPSVRRAGSPPKLRRLCASTTARPGLPNPAAMTPAGTDEVCFRSTASRLTTHPSTPCCSFFESWTGFGSVLRPQALPAATRLISTSTIPSSKPFAPLRRCSASMAWASCRSATSFSRSCPCPRPAGRHRK